MCLTSDHREIAWIRPCSTAGRKWGFMSAQPAQAVKKFKEPKRQAKFFTKDEAVKIAGAADEAHAAHRDLLAAHRP